MHELEVKEETAVRDKMSIVQEEAVRQAALSMSHEGALMG